MKWLIRSEDGITGPLFRVSFVCFNCMVFSGLTGFLMVFIGVLGMSFVSLCFYSFGLFQPTRIRKA